MYQSFLSHSQYLPRYWRIMNTWSTKDIFSSNLPDKSQCFFLIFFQTGLKTTFAKCLYPAEYLYNCIIAVNTYAAILIQRNYFFVFQTSSIPSSSLGIFAHILTAISRLCHRSTGTSFRPGAFYSVVSWAKTIFHQWFLPPLGVSSCFIFSADAGLLSGLLKYLIQRCLTFCSSTRLFPTSSWIIDCQGWHPSLRSLIGWNCSFTQLTCLC